MLKQEVSMLQEGRWPRSCDACRAVASVVFCRADALFLCSSCDSQAHAPGGAASRHERVWVCEACEQAPAVFACKADAAALCATCDMDVHSNPLASRHTRVPVLPITGDTASERERGGATVSPFLTGYVFGEETEAKGQASTLAWPFIFDSHGNYENRSYVDFLTGNEVEEYRDLGEYKPSMETMREGGYVQEYDGLELHNDAEKRYGYDHHVPAQFAGQPEERRSLDVGLGFGVPKVEITEPFALSYSISPSSIEERVVPDNTTDIKSSKLETTPSKGTLDLPEHNAERTAAAQSDRQARVLRYREKKKRRNFEKTIRYASRKAYAEIRPRIKGRFTKRIDPEQSADRMLHTTISAYEYTCGYGVVPSF